MITVFKNTFRNNVKLNLNLVVKAQNKTKLAGWKALGSMYHSLKYIRAFRKDLFSSIKYIIAKIGEVVYSIRTGYPTGYRVIKEEKKV